MYFAHEAVKKGFPTEVWKWELEKAKSHYFETMDNYHDRHLKGKARTFTKGTRTVQSACGMVGVPSQDRLCPETHLWLIHQQLRPFLPQGTLVPVLKSGLVGSPAALLVAVPEGRQADPLFQVGHPVDGKIDDPSQGAWEKQQEPLRGLAPWCSDNTQHGANTGACQPHIQEVSFKLQK